MTSQRETASGFSGVCDQPCWSATLIATIPANPMTNRMPASISAVAWRKVGSSGRNTCPLTGPELLSYRFRNEEERLPTPYSLLPTPYSLFPKPAGPTHAPCVRTMGTWVSGSLRTSFAYCCGAGAGAAASAPFLWLWRSRICCFICSNCCFCVSFSTASILASLSSRTLIALARRSFGDKV